LNKPYSHSSSIKSEIILGLRMVPAICFAAVGPSIVNIANHISLRWCSSFCHPLKLCSRYTLDFNIYDTMYAP
jgi:hypothetical protein